MRWYVVHAYSGFEKQVMRALHERIELNGLQDKFGEILVPAEEVVEIVLAKNVEANVNSFPVMCWLRWISTMSAGTW